VRICWIAVLTPAVCGFLSVIGLAADTGIGFLISARPGEVLDSEADLACETAQRITLATVVLPAGNGRFNDRRGQDISLDRFRVLWCHLGDTNRKKDRTFDSQTIAALRRFAESGRGLLLSGEAAALVAPMGLETLRVEPVRTAQDCAQAGLVPLDPHHPAFRALDLDRGVLWFTNAAFPAYSQFTLTSSPANGMLLARVPGGPNCPLVEYRAGRGAVLVLGWRLAPLYGHAAAGYRRNFERLVTNLVDYLGDPKAWRPLTVQVDGRPVVAAPIGVPEAERRSLELAIRDLHETFQAKYPRGEEFLKRLAAIEEKQKKLEAKHGDSRPGPLLVAEAAELVRQFERLKSDALRANPLLNFEKLLFIKREARKLGLPANYLGNCSLPPTGYDNEIAVLSPVGPEGKQTTLYRPAHSEFVGDVRLDYDARRLMFSMPNSAGRWRVFEMNVDGSGRRELPLIDEPDVDNYDACYLPDGRIVFCSTACFAGIPCVNGEGHVANLYLREASGKVRQLTVEQDHDWCPTVLNNGRVLYLRWEYTDLPHAFSRILFHMNPDGTEQMEFYGSNSYWPAAMFYARPIPGHPTKVVAVVGGHHELPRMGELVIFDPARGRQEAAGAVQRIPGRGRKIEPVVADLPIGQSWPKFLHPFPLSDKYLLASCQPAADAPWGIYLVDTFDNLLLLCEQRGYAMLEPIPLRETPRPPCVADKVDRQRKDADVIIADIYRGEGLRGVPRGAIKSLRVIGYHFAYEGMGAEPYSVGMDGPWDPKRILGTVPVLEDGSAAFRIPAYTPIAVQPLDAEGKAVQLMRSWLTAMPGEVVACVGCHEKQNTAPPVRRSLALGRPPVEITPWHGPARGFAFRREVQPVLDKHCARCHDGTPRSDGPVPCNLADGPLMPARTNPNRHNQEARFTASYYHLRRFVRTPCKESDIHLLNPWEYHADTTRLIQMLQKGHYDVRLDAEAWDRLITWIDLNAPFHGDWNDIRGDEIGEQVRHQSQRRAQMRERYAGMDGMPEEVLLRGEGATRAPRAPRGMAILADRDPLPASPAVREPPAGDATASLELVMSPTVCMKFVRIPPGEFLMGQENGCPDERPAHRVKIERPFWMGRFEVTNEQFALFDPAHDSRWENNDFIKFSPGELGWTLARPRQPVVRVSWTEAMAFCRWLSAKTGRQATLPTEAQWEYACRAGTATPLWYGAANSDFSRFANLSDRSHQAIDPFGDPNKPDVIAPWRPADARSDDRSRVTAPVGSYRPNPWGLFDMHGNAAEWTRSEYRPYPYRDTPSSPAGGKRVIRGGSWYDRPDRCRAAFRQAYQPDQPVYDVGFRVICE